MTRNLSSQEKSTKSSEMVVSTVADRRLVQVGLGCLIIAFANACNPFDDSDFVIEGPTVIMDPLESCTGTQVQLQSVDEQTPFGASASEILQLLPLHNEATFQWLTPDGPVVLHDFGDTSVDLVMDIQIDALAANPAYLDTDSCFPNVSCVGYCASRIEVDAQLHISLSDGSFTETWPIRLGIIKQRRNRGYEFRVHHSVDLSQMNGSFREGSFRFDPEEPGWQWYHPPIFQAEIWPKAVEHNLPSFRGRILLTPITPDGMLWFNAMGVWPPP